MTKEASWRSLCLALTRPQTFPLMKTVFLSHQIHKRNCRQQPRYANIFLKQCLKVQTPSPEKWHKDLVMGQTWWETEAYLGFCLLHEEDKVPEPRQQSWASGAEQEDLWNHTSCVWRGVKYCPVHSIAQQMSISFSPNLCSPCSVFCGIHPLHHESF